MDYNEISALEIKLISLYYTYCDQFGKVDMKTVMKIAYDQMGVIVPPTQVYMEQVHVNLLMDLALIPDTRELLTVVKLKQDPDTKD